MAAVVAAKIRKARREEEEAKHHNSDLYQGGGPASLLPVQDILNAAKKAEEAPRPPPVKIGKSSEDQAEQNLLLYVGLGLVCVGLVITVVGLGDKGFQTLQLRLVGPVLVGLGVFLTLIRILFCLFPSTCQRCRHKIKQTDPDKNSLAKGCNDGDAVKADRAPVSGVEDTGILHKAVNGWRVQGHPEEHQKKDDIERSSSKSFSPEKTVSTSRDLNEIILSPTDLDELDQMQFSNLEEYVTYKDSSIHLDQR